MDFPYSAQVLSRLKKIIADPGQVYLFYGTKGLGKLRFVTSLANRLLGTNQSDVSLLAHPNLVYVCPKEDKKLISIEQVRDVSDRIWKTSVSSKRQKIVIFNGIDKISIEAANALLKNLEDSPPHTSFFLIADSSSAVLPTIISRSQLVYFSKPKINQLVKYLQNETGLSLEQAVEYAKLAHGLPEQAISYLDQSSKSNIVSLQEKANIFLTGTITDSFIVAKDIHDQKLGSVFLSELLYATKQQSTILVLEEKINKLELILRAQSQVSVNVSTRAALENLALQMVSK